MGFNIFKKAFKSKKRSQCAPFLSAHSLYLKNCLLIKDKFIYSHIFIELIEIMIREKNF